MTRIVVPAVDFDLAAATPNCWEVRDGRLRLRPHSRNFPTHFCSVAAGPFPILAGAVGTVRNRLPELALDASFYASRAAAALLACSPIFDAYESIQVDNTIGGEIILNPTSDQINPAEFTVHLWMRLDTVGMGYLIGDGASWNPGLSRWSLYLIDASTILFGILDALGALWFLPVVLSVPLLDGDQLYLKVAYRDNGSGASDVACRVYQLSPWMEIGNAVDHAMASLPQPLPSQSPGLCVFNVDNPPALGVNATLHCLRQYDVYDGAAEFAPSAPPELYRPTQDDAVIILDAGRAGAEWDLSTFAVDDAAVWAAAVGLNGYTARYGVAEIPYSGTTSAQLTLAGLRAEGKKIGRYLELHLACKTDMYTNYSVRWAECSTTWPFPPLPAGTQDFIAELADWLATALGLPLGTRIFYHQQPDSDVLTAPAILVRHAGGAAGIDHDAWRDFNVQIMTTGALGGHAAAQTLAEQIDAILHATSNWTLPHFRVDYCVKIQEPFRLGLDERGRPQFVQNFNFEVTPI